MPNRYPSLLDLLADSLGAGFSLLLIYWRAAGAFEKVRTWLKAAKKGKR